MDKAENKIKLLLLVNINATIDNSIKTKVKIFKKRFLFSNK